MNNTEISFDFEILIQIIDDVSEVLNEDLEKIGYDDEYIDIFDALEYIAEKLRDFLMGK